MTVNGEGSAERGTDLRRIVGKVRDANLSTYGSDEQRAAIKTAVARSFTLAGVYLFELVQNALDVGASRVRLEWDDGQLVLEHDAAELFDEASIKALSKLGMSTKQRLDTVGFMGLGFKSVFQRFERVEVSDPDLRMFFEVGYDEGPYDDRHKRWIDLVLPAWDDEIAPPSAGYTTRFRLVRPLPGRRVAEDAAELVPDDGAIPDALAILALRGLREVVVGETTWTLSLRADGVGEVVTASDGSATAHWLVLRQSYRPSESAIRRLLEHRDLRVASKSEELSRDREVAALLEVDARAVPKLRRTGRVFATLPTGVELQLPILLQADWLLNAGRDGLLNATEDPWQAEIVAQVPGLLRQLVTWIRDAARSEREAYRGLDVLAGLDPASGDLHGALARPELRAAIADALADVDFLPVHVEGTEGLISTVRAGEIADVQPALLRPFQQQEDLVPSLVFGGAVLDAHFAEQHAGALNRLRQLRLLRPLGPEQLQALWPAALDDWWSLATHVPVGGDREAIETRAATAVMQLMAAIQRLRMTDSRWGGLECVLTAAGHFAAPQRVVRYSDLMPEPPEKLGVALREHLPAALLPPDVMLHPALEALLARAQGEDTAATRQLLSQGKTVEPHEQIRSALGPAVDAGRIGPEFIVLLAEWAFRRKRPGVLSHLVVVDQEGRDAVAATGDAVVAHPFVEGGDVRLEVFPTRRPVAACLLRSESAGEWRTFLEKLPGIAGPLHLRERESREFDAVRVRQITGVDMKSTASYTVVDFDFQADLQIATTGDAFARWLEQNYTQLGGRGHVTVKGFYYAAWSQKGTVACRWRQRLEAEAWVPIEGGGLARPQDVVVVRETDDQPLAAISPDLARALQAEGIRFGTAVPRPGPLTRLRGRGDTLVGGDLAALLREAIAEAQTAEEQDTLRQVAAKLTVPLDGGRRIAVDRLVQHLLGGKYRSDLRGHVASIEKVDAAVRSELARVPGLAIPTTTTGAQTFAFLRAVWAQAAEDRIDPQVPRVLSTAYGYLASDIQEDPALRAALDAARDSIRVSDGRAWISIGTSPTVVVDDLHDPELFRLVADEVTAASASHLGAGPADVARIARLLRIPLLSDWLRPEAVLTGQVFPAWLPRMRTLLRALATLDSRVEMEIEVNDSIEVVARGRRFPRLATTHQGRLHVCDAPAHFACDAAERLVPHYRLEQRGEVIPALIRTIGVVEHPDTFKEVLGRLVRMLGLDDEEIEPLLSLAAPDQKSAQAQTLSAVEPAAEPDDQARFLSSNASTSGEEANPPTTEDTRPKAFVRDVTGAVSDNESDADDDADRTGPSDQAGGRSRAPRGGGTGLPSAGYGPGWRPPADASEGEYERDDDDEDPAVGGTGSGSWPDDATGPDARRRYVVVESNGTCRSRARGGAAPTDAPARAAVVAFERTRGREPTEMGDRHEGYDVESWDPVSRRTRRIEIKTIPGTWRGQASVYLSEPQFRAGATNRDPTIEHWLYVVDAHRIYPVPWRKIGVSRFFFYAEDWADLADDVGERDAASASPATPHRHPDASDAQSDQDLFEPDWWPVVLELRDADVSVEAGGDVVDDTGRVVGTTVAVAARAGREIAIVDDAAPYAGPLEQALTTSAIRHVRTRAERAATDVRHALDARED